MAKDYMTQRYKWGFTLMELMIVIALIAILAMVGSGSYFASLKKGRDTRRKSDVKQIQKAFELYIQDQSPPSYPAEATFDGFACNVAWSQYMSKFSCNNFSTSERRYIYSLGADVTTYTLVACLENTADPEKDTTPNAGCGGNASYTITQP